MKNRGFLLLALFLGIISISASKADKFLGKWKIDKISRPGKELVEIDEETPPMWFEFKDNKVFLVLFGDGTEISNQQEWSYEEEINKLHFNTGERQVEANVLKLTARTLIIEVNESIGNSKFYLKKVSK